MGPSLRLGNTGVSSTHQLKEFLFFVELFNLGGMWGNGLPAQIEQILLYERC